MTPEQKIVFQRYLKLIQSVGEVVGVNAKTDLDLSFKPAADSSGRRIKVLGDLLEFIKREHEVLIELPKDRRLVITRNPKPRDSMHKVVNTHIAYTPVGGITYMVEDRFVQYPYTSKSVYD